VFRLKEKNTFGDDLLLGECKVQMSTIGGGDKGENMILAIKDHELSVQLTYFE
jgi:hypothetical protein